MEIKTKLQAKVKLLPTTAGCYLFKDKNDNLIYVGKATSLQKRVMSYLNKASNLKTMLLVNDIADINYITTLNEKEALILEQTLIKKHHPKYNILLADDKKYPYIQITNNRDPQYRYVRSASKKEGRYYGPFPDGSGARDILKLLERLFPLRKCRGNLGKPCLYYHLGQCSGACFQIVPVSYYETMISKIDQFFKGNVAGIKRQITANMQLSAQNLQFENANRLKNLLAKIDLFLSQQVVEFQDYGNRDFINFLVAEDMVVLITLFYRHGKLQAKDQQIVTNNYFDLSALMRNYCQQLYSKNTLPQEIYLPSTIILKELKLLFPQVKFFHPVKGVKEQILTLAKTNAIYAWNHYLQQDKRNDPQNIMKVLGQWLKIPHLNHCEIFDVSNLHHDASVGAMIVYKNGVASPNDFRRFFLDQQWHDDYHRFGEMIYRRYYYLMINKLPLPDVIIVDGGKPQISVTLQQLQLLNITIPVIGLAKNQKHQTDRILDSNYRVINIPKNDPCFLFLSKVQDQVHNFALKYHHLKRSQTMINSILAAIPGIGPQLQAQILAQFPTWPLLQAATEKQLLTLIKSKKIVAALWQELHSFDNN